MNAAEAREKTAAAMESLRDEQMRKVLFEISMEIANGRTSLRFYGQLFRAVFEELENRDFTVTKLKERTYDTQFPVHILHEEAWEISW